MENEAMLRADYEDMSNAELMVLLVVGEEGHTMRTRLQKITLLFEEVYGDCETGHSAYFFGGYSDEIDEAASYLVSAGMMTESDSGYVLTSYGRRLREYILGSVGDDDPEGEVIAVGIRRIVGSLRGIRDNYVVGLTYHYYEDTAVDSTIRESVAKLNRGARYGGRRLADISRDEFEKALREGKAVGA